MPVLSILTIMVSFSQNLKENKKISSELVANSPSGF